MKPQQLKTLALICKGYTTNQIAYELNLSPRAVESRRALLLQKTDCKSSIGLLVYALKNELVYLDQL